MNNVMPISILFDSIIVDIKGGYETGVVSHWSSNFEKADKKSKIPETNRIGFLRTRMLMNNSISPVYLLVGSLRCLNLLVLHVVHLIIMHRCQIRVFNCSEACAFAG